MGLDGFAITDHDTLKGIPEATENGGGLIVIPGLEVSARGAHILALDVREPVPARLLMAETVEKIHEQGALAAIGHPHVFLKPFLKEREVAGARFDAVEVANASRFPYSWTRTRNATLARRLGLPRIGGSDAHIPETVGRAYTTVESRSREVEDIIRAIRAGQSEAEGRGISLSERLKKFVG